MNSSSLGRIKVQRLRARFRDQTGDIILAAAERVFGEHGLDSASMNEIAKRAGVAVGTLYNHFKDRDALLEALLTQRRVELVACLDTGAAGVADKHFRAQLEAMLLGLFAHFDAHRAFFLILLQDRPRGQASGAATVSIPRSTLEEVYVRFAKLVELGVKEKTLRVAGSQLFPALLMGIVRSVATREVYTDTPSNLANRVPQLMEFFLRGAGA